MKRTLCTLFALLTLSSVVTVAVATVSSADPRQLRPVPAATIAPANATNWSCVTGTFFQTLNGQLSTSTNLLHWRKVGHRLDVVNALAYSPFTKYLYAIDAAQGKSHDHLIQIDRFGAQVDLGAVTGLPQFRWRSGEIDPSSGIYYVGVGATPLMAIDISSRTATPAVVPDRVLLGYDMVIQRGWLWSINATAIDGFSLSTLATKEFLLPKSTLEDAVGSVWSDVAGDGLYFRWNARGVIYHVAGLRSNSVTFTRLGAVVTRAKANDGATCNGAVAPAADDAPVLQVSGNAGKLFSPGKSRRIDLTFTNTYGTAVTVWPRVIKISLANSSARCPAATNFRVDQGVTVAVTVPASSTVTLSQLHIPSADWPVITMVNTSRNQDACQGTVLHMRYYIRYYG